MTPGGITSPRLTRALVAGALYVATSAHIGHCFGHGDQGTPPPVAPEAQAWVLEGPDGQLGAGVEVTHPASGELLPVAELRLSVDGEELAHGDGDALTLDTYDPAGAYALSFTLDAEAAGVPVGPYRLAKHGPLERPSAWWHDDHTVAWDPAGLLGYVEVHDTAGEVRWTNREEMERGGRQEIPLEALEGSAEVLVCAVEVLRMASTPTATPAHDAPTDRIEGQLGHRSTLVVGRCDRLTP